MSGDRTDQTWARCYDESLPPGVVESAPDEAALLAELAGAGPAMEIGIGTGRFVVEAAVPNLNGFVGGERVSVDRDEDGAIKVLVVEQHQAAVQRLLTEIFVMHGDGRYDRLPTTLRYAYPDELDLMARQAGMALLERWSDWQRSPFHDDSLRHISVYG